LRKYHFGLKLKIVSLYILQTSGLRAISVGLGCDEAKDDDCSEEGDTYNDPGSLNQFWAEAEPEIMLIMRR
jgi:hypothetical protein